MSQICYAILDLCLPVKRVTHRAAGSPWPTVVPGWITAAGTAVLAIFAIVTALYAVRAFRKQSKEVSDQAEMLRVQSGQLEEQRKLTALQTPVLKLQAKELGESIKERQREAEERRRAQAARVFIWQEYREGNPALSEGPPPPYMAHLRDPGRGESLPVMVAHVENTSDQPIYRLIVRWKAGGAFHSQSEELRPLMPHKQKDLVQEIPGAKTDPSILSAVAFFRDAAGVYWKAHPDGTFDEIPEGEVPVT